MRNKNKFERPIIGERAMLMLPLNVVLIGRVNGEINPQDVSVALEKLRTRHPFLAVKVEYDKEDRGYFITENVPAISVYAESRNSNNQWLEQVKTELKTSFPIETGPLVRVSVLSSSEYSEIILCGHHAICDGMSLGYLLRDLLNGLANPEQKIDNAIFPPPIDDTTVPNSPKSNFIVRSIMKLMNRKWARKKIRFNEQDMMQMHKEYWKHNDELQIAAWEMTSTETKTFVERCKAENVTVNSAIWTAFLTAQQNIEGNQPNHRTRAALAVSNRNKLKTPAGEAMGFYASSLSVKLPFEAEKSFWDNARRIHSKISKQLSETNLFRMLSADLLHPTLLDSLYFQKLGLLNEGMSKRMLQKMNWHDVAYGYAITNVGRFDIPKTYGSYHLEAVYGPVFYSDVEEKMLGVITVGDRLSFILTVNKKVIPDLMLIKDTAMKFLSNAIKKRD